MSKKVKKDLGDSVSEEKDVVIEVKVKKGVGGWLETIREFFRKLRDIEFVKEDIRCKLYFRPGVGLMRADASSILKDDLDVDDENLMLMEQKMKAYIGKKVLMAEKAGKSNDVRLASRANHFLNGFFDEIKKVSV